MNPLAEWSKRNPRDGGIPIPHTMAFTHFETHFHAGHTPSFVLGAGTIVLIKASKTLDSHDRINYIETLKERRHTAKTKWLSYEKLISKAYNKRVRPRTLSVGDLVLEARDTFRNG